MEYIQLSMDDYTESKKEIREKLGSIVRNFVYIGWQLTRIDRSGAYKMDGYASIAELARTEYGMNASGVSRFMSVYEKYSVEGDTPKLKVQYRQFNFSQLAEMMKLPEEDQTLIWPEAKREDIREMQRFNKENENNPDNLLNWKKEPEDKLTETVWAFFRENQELFKTLLKKWPEGNTKAMANLINPSGSRSYRKGTVFLMFYEKNIFVKQFGAGTLEISWEEFFERARPLFEMGIQGEPEKQQEEPSEGQQPAAEDSQIPGQDTIENHPEYMPEPQIAPAQKTEEQKYNEQQAKIDRETKRKLEEQEDREKMAHLPSDEGQKAHFMRLPYSNFNDVASGNKPFELCRYDRKYHVGDMVELQAFEDGRFNGRMIRADITYILEDYTGLEDGYCILALKVREVI